MAKTTSVFNPIPTSQDHKVDYDFMSAGKMSLADFSKSPVASLLFFGQGLTDEQRAPYLKAWHEDAVRLYNEATPDTSSTDNSTSNKGKVK